jgi:geranylgeranyl diphosphate synthase type II
LSDTSQTIERYLAKQAALVDQELERLVPPAEDYPPSIHRAMRYSVFAGGKRLRPILCLEAGRLFAASDADLLPVAAALEFVHTYSLIHDDLPALDNDDLRRGKPSCHRAFGEATAILAGDALLTRAFEILSRPGAPEARKLGLIHTLSSAIGTSGGMVAGQVVDLETTGHAVDAKTLEFIHSAKTGALIRTAVLLGALAADAPDTDLERLTTYGAKVGLSFQIVDDLLDVVGSKEALGKAVGKDRQQQKATYPALHGVEESRRIAAKLVEEACATLAPYRARADRLQAIARFLVARKS